MNQLSLALVGLKRWGPQKCVIARPGVRRSPNPGCGPGKFQRYAARSTLITQLSRSLVLINALGTTGILIPKALNAALMRAAWIASIHAIPASSSIVYGDSTSWYRSHIRQRRRSPAQCEFGDVDVTIDITLTLGDVSGKVIAVRSGTPC